MTSLTKKVLVIDGLLQPTMDHSLVTYSLSITALRKEI